jgi:asparagine synthase (glutamine-hydrolysing)
MCGITGVWSVTDFALSREALPRMTAAIARRGPDDAGHWFDEAAGIALGHRRLSIVDLSPAGHQPMVSASGRYQIIFNGEIYNHVALRRELEQGGQRFEWRGHSDTETLLAGIEVWGFEATLKRCIGMFAMALWDRETRSLQLARDRLGEKPLYYGWQGQHFFFASELSALKAHPAFKPVLNPQAIALMMRHNYIPSPYSIYQGIAKLTPGTTLLVSPAHRDATPTPYWRAYDAVANGLADPFTGSPAEAVDALESLLMDAVGQQMMADVPLGAFLSGGVDSSAVVALMQAQSDRPVQTFTIGFNEAGYNEAVHAKAVAKHLGTQHTEWYVTPQDALNVIPKLPGMYSEPFSDSSQIPTFLVSQLARRQVTVSLSGDGGDELFGGYNRYTQTHRLWSTISRLPIPLRKLAAAGITSLSPSHWNALASPLMAILPAKYQHRNIGGVAHKGAGVLACKSVDAIYHTAVSHWNPADLLFNGAEPLTTITDPHSMPPCDAIHRMMALDTISYLPGDILCKVDRAAMAVSLESRVPLLDHRVVEFAWSLPLEMKLRDGVGKWPLREVLYRHVPKSLIERPKMGFGIPIDDWLRGPLKDWAEALLDEKRLREQGLFKPELIRWKWAEHQSGKANWQYQLWDVLMFQAWHEAQGRA